MACVPRSVLNRMTDFFKAHVTVYFAFQNEEDEKNVFFLLFFNTNANG